MNNLTLNKLTVLFTLVAMSALYQNFDFPGLLEVPVNTVDPDARIAHAKELLGKGYKGSVAHKAEKIADLNVTIYETVARALPKKYRRQALPLTETIIAEAQKYDFDPVFIMAVIKTESAFNPKARGTSGEIGLMQLKPTTASEIAKRFKLSWHGPSTLENPVENVKIGIAYFSELRTKFSGFANKYLSAYNMGAAKVKKMYRVQSKPKIYSLRVINNYKTLYTGMVASRLTTVAGNQ
jgi:soluble lytic murein transglycosylase